MKKIHILTIAFLLSINSNAQLPSYQWAISAGSTSGGAEDGKSVAYDQFGNIYVTGSYQGTVDFDPGVGVTNLVSNGSDDVFLAKYTSAGSLVWAISIGSAQSDIGYALAIDGNNDAVITGVFRTNNVDFDPGVGTATLTNSGGGDIFVAKYNSTGSYLWAFSIGSSNLGNPDEGLAITSDISNNIFITGSYSGSSDFDPGIGSSILTSAFNNTTGFVAKYTSSGLYGWAFSLELNSNPTGTQKGFGIKTDNSGNVCLTGYFNGTNDFDPSASVNSLISVSATQDVFLAKYSTVGNLIFAFNIGSSGVDWGKGISIDQSNNILVTGFFSGIADFDPSASTSNLTPIGNRDIFVAKYSSGGNYVWAFKIGSTTIDEGECLYVDNIGDIYIGGNFTSTADFDPGVGVANLTSSGGADVFMAKYNSGGNYLWAAFIGEPTFGEYCRSISVNPQGMFYITGYFVNTVDFDPNAGVANLSSILTSSDLYLAKYSSCISAPSQPPSISGLNSMCTGAGATTYSVAVVSGATSYTWFLPGGWSGTSSTNTISATPGSSGIFTVTASNACGTSAQQTLSVTVNPLPTITVNSSTICSGQSFTIVPSGATTYTIQGGSAVVSPLSNTNYTVTGTSAAGCVSASSATSNVAVNATPTITVNSGSICSGQSFTIVPGGANTYTIQGGSAVVSPLSNTSYTVVGTSTAGCVSASSATSNVVVNANPTITVNSGTICSGQSFTIVPSGASSYTFQGGGAVKTPTSTTSYTVTGTSTAGCVSASPATSTITVNSTPTITVNSGAICNGQSFTIAPSGASTYTFSTGPVVSPTVTSSYSVTGTSSLGCVSSSAAISNVTVNPLPTITANTSSTLICTGQSATLTASGASTYTWNPGGAGTSIVVSPTVNSTYTITGTNSFGCINASTFTQLVDPCLGISQLSIFNSELVIYPNPTNGEVYATGVKENTLIEIYNVLGQKVVSAPFSLGEGLGMRLQPNGIYFIKIGNITKKIIKE